MTKKQKLLRQQIKRLSAADWLQTEIAERCGVSRLTVRTYQRSLGLPTRHQKLVPAGESLAACLHGIESLYPDGLPFAREFDTIAADAMVSGFRERHSKLLNRTPKVAITEFHGLLMQALSIKRSCSDSTYFVN